MSYQTLLSSVHTYSLLMNLRNFVCNIGEDSELLMSLYDPDQSEFIRSPIFINKLITNLKNNSSFMLSILKPY